MRLEPQNDVTEPSNDGEQEIDEGLPDRPTERYDEQRIRDRVQKQVEGGEAHDQQSTPAPGHIRRHESWRVIRVSLDQPSS